MVISVGIAIAIRTATKIATVIGIVTGTRIGIETGIAIETGTKTKTKIAIEIAIVIVGQGTTAIEDVTRFINPTRFTRLITTEVIMATTCTAKVPTTVAIRMACSPAPMTRDAAKATTRTVHISLCAVPAATARFTAGAASINRRTATGSCEVTLKATRTGSGTSAVASSARIPKHFRWSGYYAAIATVAAFCFAGLVSDLAIDSFNDLRQIVRRAIRNRPIDNALPKVFIETLLT